MVQAQYCRIFGFIKSHDTSVKLWHECFGHLWYDNQNMLNEKVMVEGLNLKADESDNRS